MESRNYNAQSGNKASKCNEGRKEPWATGPQCGHKTVSHQNLVWSSLEMLTRAGIVSPLLANILSTYATQIVTIQSVVHSSRAGVSAERCLGILFPLKTILHVSYVGRNNGSKHISDITAFFGGGRVRRYQRSCHIPNIEKTKR